jgi:hypothetical protein
MSGGPLIDAHDMYRHPADYRAEIMQDDCYPAI